VQLVVAIILARLLSPEEFGTIALLYLFTGIASVFIDAGLSSALIRNQNASRIDESTIFFINVFMGCAAASSFLLAAPWLAEFYNQPILEPIARVLAASLLVNSIGATHLALFRKRLDFRRPMMASAAASISSGGFAIWMASYGYGIWALAWQTIFNSIIFVLLLWAFSPWRPSFVFSASSAVNNFRFGFFLMLSALLDVAYNRMYSLLIGKYYSVADLAFYSRAENTRQIPVEALSNSIAQVVFPVFCRLAEDRGRLSAGMSTSLKMMMLINVPMMCGLCVTAENVIGVLFGEKWLPAVPILQVLSLAGLLWPFHVVNLLSLQAQGHANIFFRLEIIKKIIGVCFVFIGTFHGVLGIAWSQVAIGIVAVFVNTYYTKNKVGYSIARQIRDVLPIFNVSIFMSLVVYFVSSYSILSKFYLFPLQICIGVFVFFGAARIFRIQALDDCFGLVKAMKAEHRETLRN
jgi:O-antigen/teichoic acid export membrane protein